MPKRKLLSEMSKRHYRRLKYSARNITITENIDKLSTNFAEVHDVQNSSDIITHVITEVNCELDQDQATNVTLRNEPLQQYCNIFLTMKILHIILIIIVVQIWRIYIRWH